MTNTYTLKHQLSSETETLLLAINTVCTELRIEFFVAGATAREVMLTHVHGRRSGRQTRDIDIAVFINHWQQFDLLKNAMIERGAKPLKHNQHRLIWDGMELDIIPFGPIAEENKIAWPPDREITLHVDGFQEAWEHASRVHIPTNAEIRFSSLPGLLLLKIFAWRDRGGQSSKDAVDIFKILQEYSRIEEDRVYDNNSWCERVDWNPERLGALLAGSDTAAIATEATLQGVLKLDKARLADAIVRQNEHVPADEIENIIDDFWYGLSGK